MKPLGARAALAVCIVPVLLCPPAFAAGPESQQPGVNATVSPSDGLSSPQNVSVSGTGFAASTTIEIEQCFVTSGTVTDCGQTLLTSTTANASGVFGPVTVTVSRTFTTQLSGTANCWTQACVVRAIGTTLPLRSAFHHLGFAGTPATITTQASGAVALGGSIFDTATVTGIGTPTGTVTFTLFGPNDAACAGPAIFQSAKPLAGGTASSDPFTPTAAGTYRWRAAYGGDINHAAGSAVCNAPNENVVVSAPGTGSGIGTSGGSGANDTVKPVLGPLTLSPARFRAARSGPSVAQARPPLGTDMKFNLSERGSVRFTVERRAAGRRVGGKCVKPRRSNRGRRRCTRWVKVSGSFTVPAAAGENRFKFSGRIGGKRLKPRRYRLVGRATDPANNRSDRRTKRFRIVR